ncbi:MAG: hypothetical protein AAF587_09340 [Bacteroidota bacterium]
MKQIVTYGLQIVLAGTLMFIAACDPFTPIEILNAENNVLNPSVEEGSDLPSEWYFSEGDSIAKNAGFWVSGDGFESSRSLKITQNTEEIEYIYWAQTRMGRPLNGKTVVLKAMVRASGLEGQGATLIVRGDHSDEPKGEGESLATSQGIAKIIGSHDWTEYEVVLEEGMDKKTESVSVYLALLPETTGTVYFDQISLSYRD